MNFIKNKNETKKIKTKLKRTITKMLINIMGKITVKIIDQVLLYRII